MAVMTQCLQAWTGEEVTAELRPEVRSQLAKQGRRVGCHMQRRRGTMNLAERGSLGSSWAETGTTL